MFGDGDSCEGDNERRIQNAAKVGATWLRFSPIFSGLELIRGVFLLWEGVGA